ncbi:unnamed protein product, partial [Prorocentrum cordatum]
MLAVASSSELVPGELILVRYGGAALWHERLLCWPLPPKASGVVGWIVSTPDADQYAESIVGGDPTDSPVEWLRLAADGRLPRGVRGDIYTFAAGELGDGHLRTEITRAATYAAKIAPGTDEAPATCPIVRLANGQRAGVEDLLGAAFIQHALRLPDGGSAAPRRGEAGALVVGGTGTPETRVWRVVESDNVLGCELGREEPPDFVARISPRGKADTPAPPSDARPPLAKRGAGGRGRDWKDVVDSCQLEDFEAAIRRVQTIEWAYHDKIRETDAGSSSRLSIEEATAFSGLSRAGDLPMAVPSFLDHAKAKVEKGAALMKNIRKTKEERELRRKQKDKPG